MGINRNRELIREKSTNSHPSPDANEVSATEHQTVTDPPLKPGRPSRAVLHQKQRNTGAALTRPTLCDPSAQLKKSTARHRNGLFFTRPELAEKPKTNKKYLHRFSNK